MSETLVETVEYRGVEVEIHVDYDAMNPIEQFDGQPILVLSEKAASNYSLGQDADWCRTIDDARERTVERAWRWLRHRDGIEDYWAHPTPAQADAMARRGGEMLLRYLRAFHDVAAILPMGMGDHSGIWVYLGDGPSISDPGGWDSGHAGYLLVTHAMLRESGCEPDYGEQYIRDSFEEFRAYVSNETYGYVIDDPAVVDDSCWGFYGSSCWDEARGDKPMGYMRDAFQDVIDHALDARHAERVSLFKELVATR